MPARSISRWETISASFGVSLRMGRKYRDRRMGRPMNAGFDWRRGAFARLNRSPGDWKAGGARVSKLRANLRPRTAPGAAWQNNDTTPEKCVTLRIRLDTLATITKGAGRCDFCGLVLGGRDFRRGSCRSPDQRHRSEIQTRDFGCKAKALHFFCPATACSDRGHAGCGAPSRAEPGHRQYRHPDRRLTVPKRRAAGHGGRLCLARPRGLVDAC
ncbi:hypothetical protein SI859A1_01957 [Aurantimonas manganoxydans SI85-9A1]|uniref:Uncharacterized protein n=1 Tax=Aurantimonas manganoxydans (strain ATCC BAA-1229 / DSM 21871 / SI85-9A1) TaxID=287752 RepID=Q1YN84_AURMS|nr:hypothetical protein SI859A1_01957 [Aurantimonas manganoxydans SI85-9A1]